jgi:hypothetical protein
MTTTTTTTTDAAKSAIAAERELLAVADSKSAEKSTKLLDEIHTLASKHESANRLVQLKIGRRVQDYLCQRMGQVDKNGDRVKRLAALDEVCETLESATGNVVRRSFANQVIRHWFACFLCSPDGSKVGEVETLGVRLPTDLLKSFSGLLEKIDSDTSKETWRIKGEWKDKAIALFEKCSNKDKGKRPSVPEAKSQIATIIGKTSATTPKEPDTSDTEVKTALAEKADSSPDGTVEPGEQTPHVAATIAAQALREGPAEEDVDSAYRCLATDATLDQAKSFMLGIVQTVLSSIGSDDGDTQTSAASYWADLWDTIEQGDQRIRAKIDKITKPIEEKKVA